MAIYTRFGTEVEIVGCTWDKGWVDVKYLKYPDEDALPDAQIRHTYLNELVADDGIAEIKEAVKGLPDAMDKTD